MKKTTFLLLFLFVALNLVAQKRAYKIYNAKGKKVSYNRMLKKLAKNDIVLFGELHNNPIAHWLQYEVTNDLHKTRKLILGAEMFEADNQQPLSQYVNGSINSKQLDTLARLWSNYKTDYAPLVNFAKDQKLNFVASNIPRRYANLVYKKGFEAVDALSDTEKSWIAPLPIKFDSELPTYKKILTMMGDHGTPKLVMAQAIKDATMAHFILKNHLPNHLFLHYNGAYHSDYYEGILWYLKNENPNLNYATITTVLQKDINKLEKENLKKADFIICVDDNMTTTY
ncbi:ChaN family lipoprotein [Tenacibaculum sp. L6]|uniref:ChaN family lipoprotein n=1 Tax=Tenacibaculum sp. L6 TaxID=2992764 RepID=UPI00237AB75A|nr:ChaN family lipoprotein [Tenacibaculum sp. L6]MDE0535966.1 ChaN family lipoprotein [Tenacibaculum sp. L6]